MDPQIKRTLLATVLCLGILVVWFKVQAILYPPPPVEPVTTAPADAARTAAAQDAGEAQAPAITSSPPAGQPGAEGAELRAAEFHAPDATSTETIVLGDDRQDNGKTGFTNPYDFAAVITPRGAGVESLNLSQYRNELAKDKKDPDHDPYDLLQEIRDPNTDRRYASFVTEQIRFKAPKQKKWQIVDLADTVWTLEKTTDVDGEAATLRTVVQKGEADILALEKGYRLVKRSRHLEVSLTLQNLSDEPCEVYVTQRGPIGIKKEDYRYEYRKIVTALVDDQAVTSLGSIKTRDEIFKADDAGRKLSAGDKHTLWAALGNKYFACIVAPRPLQDDEEASGPSYPEYLAEVSGAFFLDDKEAKDDLTFVMTFHPPDAIGPGNRLTMNFEAFCGPKSEALFETLPEAVARNYHLIRSADSRWCTFEIITTVMLWLLTKVYGLVGNYGIAIIVLVIIVRLVLHPVTKRGQINMMKMQKGMARLKPKLEVIQQKYKNDKQKLQEEQMKLYKEEGINPAGQFLGCLPMVLQMPVWVALWTTLNTNVDMRHMPFFSWINDLSAPDALIPFAGEYHIPLIGVMMGPITAFNLLPLIMTATMYAQQKITQKLTKPVTPPQPKTDKDGKPLPDTMAQQQKIMSFMMIFFGFIFYNFPSGLNLYILSSNLLGMVEQWRIKKHIREQEDRGEFEVAKKAGQSGDGKPSLFRRHIEQLQKRAEQARLAQPGRSQGRPLKKHKKTKV